MKRSSFIKSLIGLPFVAPLLDEVPVKPELDFTFNRFTYPLPPSECFEKFSGFGMFIPDYGYDKDGNRINWSEHLKRIGISFKNPEP